MDLPGLTDGPTKVCTIRSLWCQWITAWFLAFASRIRSTHHILYCFVEFTLFRNASSVIPHQQKKTSTPQRSARRPLSDLPSGLQIRLWTAVMASPSFSNILSSAQPLRSYRASTQIGSFTAILKTQAFPSKWCMMYKVCTVITLKKMSFFLEIMWDNDDPPMEWRGPIGAVPPWKALGQHNSLDRCRSLRGSWGLLGSLSIAIPPFPTSPVRLRTYTKNTHPVTHLSKYLPWAIEQFPLEQMSTQDHHPHSEGTAWNTCRLTKPKQGKQKC